MGQHCACAHDGQLERRWSRLQIDEYSIARQTHQSLARSEQPSHIRLMFTPLLSGALWTADVVNQLPLHHRKNCRRRSVGRHPRRDTGGAPDDEILPDVGILPVGPTWKLRYRDFDSQMGRHKGAACNAKPRHQIAEGVEVNELVLAPAPFAGSNELSAGLQCVEDNGVERVGVQCVLANTNSLPQDKRISARLTQAVSPSPRYQVIRSAIPVSDRPI